MISYRIQVRVIPEGECRYRKSEAQIPRLPEWSQYTEGGRTFTKAFSGKVELQHIKRWFRHDLYYKAYRLEYVAWHKTIFNGVIMPPDKEYLDWIIQQINPSPNELLIESRQTVPRTECNILPARAVPNTYNEEYDQRGYAGGKYLRNMSACGGLAEARTLHLLARGDERVGHSHGIEEIVLEPCAK